MPITFMRIFAMYDGSIASLKHFWEKRGYKVIIKEREISVSSEYKSHVVIYLFGKKISQIDLIDYRKMYENFYVKYEYKFVNRLFYSLYTLLDNANKL